jgi:hypothetical protein
VTQSTVAAALLFALSAAGVAATQPRLARVVHTVKERGDVYALPPPAQLHAATLGWDAAIVDMLWCDLLVAYGTHWSEHRDFLEIPNYVDAILELDPAFAPVYNIVDTLLAYRPMQGTEKDARLARHYLELGIGARPTDARLWTRYGQFLAFISPSFLHDDAEKAVWRQDGARAMGRAVELGADPDRALTAATLLTTGGAKQAAITYLEHAYSLTDHPAMREIHESIGRRLASLEASAQRDAADAADRAIDAHWSAEMPHLARDHYLLLGPIVDPLQCAGLEKAGEPRCARDWSPIVERADRYR